MTIHASLKLSKLFALKTLSCANFLKTPRKGYEVFKICRYDDKLIFIFKDKKGEITEPYFYNAKGWEKLSFIKK